jgi:hypothetical protein
MTGLGALAYWLLYLFSCLTVLESFFKNISMYFKLLFLLTS